MSAVPVSDINSEVLSSLPSMSYVQKTYLANFLRHSTEVKSTFSMARRYVHVKVHQLFIFSFERVEADDEVTQSKGGPGQGEIRPLHATTKCGYPPHTVALWV